MDPVLRALAVYAFLLVTFRAFGKRSLAQITTFDFVMLLIIAETTQQALLGEDFSLTNCFLLIATLIVTDTVLALIKHRWPWFDRLSEGMPLIILENGRPHLERMRRSRADVDDVLAAARERQGLERLDRSATRCWRRMAGSRSSQGNGDGRACTARAPPFPGGFGRTPGYAISEVRIRSVR